MLLINCFVKLTLDVNSRRNKLLECLLICGVLNTDKYVKEYLTRIIPGTTKSIDLLSIKKELKEIIFITFKGNLLNITTVFRI